jgi:hypothetical protein
MKLTVTEIAVHKETENPIFGELVTHVKLDDEAGGMFIKLVQSTDAGYNEIRLDFNEIEYILKAIEMLKVGDTDDSDKSPVEQIKELVPQARIEMLQNQKIRKAQAYDVLVKELFVLLDRKEETDEGRVFRPVQISCCRGLDAEKLEQVLKELKQTLED